MRTKKETTVDILFQLEGGLPHKVGTMIVPIDVEVVTTPGRRPFYAEGATTQISFDLPRALRELADELENGI